MSWVHPILNGVMACCFGIVSFNFWRSLVQEMKIGKVEDLNWQAARIACLSLIAFAGLWTAIAPPKSGTPGDYVRWGLIFLAIAAIIMPALIRRKPGRLQ